MIIKRTKILNPRILKAARAGWFKKLAPAEGLGATQPQGCGGPVGQLGAGSWSAGVEGRELEGWLQEDESHTGGREISACGKWWYLLATWPERSAAAPHRVCDFHWRPQSQVATKSRSLPLLLSLQRG